MSVAILSFKITGISPLLMNNPASMKRSGGMNTKKIPSPEDEAASKTYRDDAGNLVMKTMAFRSSLLGACSGRRLGKMSARQVVAGAVFTTATETALFDPDSGKALSEYKINIARAVVQKSGVLRARPEVPKWSCNLDLEVDDDFIPDAAIIEELLNIAGKIKGVGDWRPEKMGPYGRFRVERVGNTVTAKKM